MNTPVPPAPNDDELTPEERELAELYLQLPQAEPDRALDDDVLASAAHPHRRWRAPRWVLGVGTAAVLVLAAGIAWRLHQPGAPAPVPAGAPSARPTSTAAALQSRTVPPPAPHAASAVPAPPAPPPPVQRKSTPATPPTYVPKAAILQAAPAPPPAPPAPPPPARGMAQSLPSADVYELVPAHPASKVVHASGHAATAPAPPPPVEEVSVNAAAAPPQPPADIAPASTAPLPTTGAIAHIRALLRAGKRAEAVRALHAFKQVHADYPLPADLKALDSDGH